MRFQMSLLRVVERFHQCAFVNIRTGITHIRDMESNGTDFLHEIRTMFIAATGFAQKTGTAFARAVCTAESGDFDLAVVSFLTGIEGKTRFAGGNLY